ncbi:MAG: hypothetical protein ACRCSG_01940 [Cellulosilyticaceae bacterium]
MLFNNLFFPSNRTKEEQIQQLEQQLISLFENYHIAWNNFCKVSQIEDYIPTLKKSIKENTLEECIKEIDYATTILEDTINNIIDHIDLHMLFKKCNYKIQSLESAWLKNVIQYLPISIGGLSGIGISAYVCHRIFLKYNVFNKFIDHISNIYDEELAALISSLIPQSTPPQCNTNKVINYSNKLSYQLYAKFSSNICNSNISPADQTIATNLLKKTIDNKCIQARELLASKVSLSNPFLSNIVTDSTLINTPNSFPDFLLYDVDALHNIISRNTFIVVDPNYNFVTSDNLFNPTFIFIPQKPRSMFYVNSSILGIGIIATITILLDMLISSVENFVQSKLLDQKCSQITTILTELTTLMTKETVSLINLTSNIQDGILYFDKKHMVLVDNNNNLKLLTLKD